MTSLGLAPAFAAPFVGGAGPDTLIGAFGNDTFRGLPGNDTLVGDFFDVSVEDLTIPCRAGAGLESQGGDGADGQVSDLLNDVFDDGPGNDFILGDVGITHDFDELQLFAGAGTGALFGGSGGDFNTARCFSDSNSLAQGEDSFRGGPGSDTYVGDAFYHNTQPEDLNLDAGAGSAGMGQFSFFPYEPGGNGGNNNVLQAFNDLIDFEFAAGVKLLVGDALSRQTAGSEDHLTASAGSGAGDGATGGNTNTLSAFSDVIRGGAGNERIYGDDFRDRGVGDVVLVASAGAGGDGANAGAGGANNSVRAFADDISGGNGADNIVGDAFLSGGPTDNLRFIVHAGYSRPAGGAGGIGNAVSAFDDRLSGGLAADTIVGDGQNVFDNEGVRFEIGGDAGNDISAFRDDIDGGNGADRIHGDLRYTADVCDIDQLEISGAFNGRTGLFGDRIDAGMLDDRIHGGFGSDDMTGGAGRDTYFYYEPDLLELAAGAGPPVDLIRDFQVTGPFAGRDLIDLRPLLVSCRGLDIAGGDDPNDWMRIVGTQLQVDLDGPGAAFGWSPILTAASLAGRQVNFLRANQNLLP